MRHHPSFSEIREEVGARAPDIDCRIIEDRRLKAQRLAFATRPTLVFSPVPVGRFKPMRGRVYAGRSLSKSDEYRALEAAGIPVPRWALLGPQDTPDLSGFSEYVVSKPDRGKRGANVKIKRRGRVRYKPEPGSSNDGLDRTLIQEFIYTGRWPVSYRVTSMFGRVLHCWRLEADQRRRPLQAADAFGGDQEGGGISIVSSGKGSVITLCNDEDIIAFGTGAHRAFPDIPVLGVDVVRDVRNGRLFVLEVNAIGYVWHLDSDAGRGIQRDHGLDFREQFGAIERAADLLIEKTRNEAR
jgi:hypothetical protein